MQYRDKTFKSFPGCVTTFGGRVEGGETPAIALAWELKEEIGAKVLPETPILLGVFT